MSRLQYLISIINLQKSLSKDYLKGTVAHQSYNPMTVGHSEKKIEMSIIVIKAWYTFVVYKYHIQGLHTATGHKPLSPLDIFHPCNKTFRLHVVYYIYTWNSFNSFIKSCLTVWSQYQIYWNYDWKSGMRIILLSERYRIHFIIFHSFIHLIIS